MEQHLRSMEMFLRNIWQLKSGGKRKLKSPSKCKNRKVQASQGVIHQWRAAMKSRSITDKLSTSELQKPVLRTCKNAPLCFSTQQPLKSLAAFEITAPDFMWAVRAFIYIKHPPLWHLLLLLSVCLLNPCWNGDSKSQKHEEECYFYLLAWKFCVSFSVDTRLRPHSSWPWQHNLRCWSFNAWIPWRSDGVTVQHCPRDNTVIFHHSWKTASGRFSLLFPSCVSTSRCGT